MNSTFFSEESGCQSAGDAGLDSPTMRWSGENMESFGMNSARSFLGKNVNLHLKDGSVIVNVQLGEIRKDEFKNQRLVTCVSYRGGTTLRIPLKSIAWAELLNLNLIRGGQPGFRNQ